MKRALANWLESHGLLEAVNELRGLGTLLRPRVLLGNAGARLRGAPDGLPIPPARLIYLVAGSYSIEWFLTLGRDGAQSIVETLARHDIDVAKLNAVLDFGCGCGRVLRYFARYKGVRLHGTDYNPRPIAWCRQRLGGGSQSGSAAQFETNQLAPPLPYPDASFDLVYALSVFTHLDEELQRAWLDELRRVSKPGGHVLITMHGAAYLPGLSPPEQAEFAADRLVVRRRHLAGKNICTTFCSQRYVQERLLHAGEMLEFVPEGARGNPTQDLYLLRVGQPDACGSASTARRQEPQNAGTAAAVERSPAKECLA